MERAVGRRAGGKCSGEEFVVCFGHGVYFFSFICGGSCGGDGRALGYPSSVGFGLTRAMF